MRRILFIAMLLLISGGTAQAAGPATPAPTAKQATRIETDQKTGAILFIVKGREVARFDADGLHVRDSIDYNGLLADGSTVYTSPEPAKPAKAEPKH